MLVTRRRVIGIVRPTPKYIVFVYSSLLCRFIQISLVFLSLCILYNYLPNSVMVSSFYGLIVMIKSRTFFIVSLSLFTSCNFLFFLMLILPVLFLLLTAYTVSLTFAGWMLLEMAMLVFVRANSTFSSVFIREVSAGYLDFSF